MEIEWSDDLDTGISVIDEQHKELFRRINALLAACQESKARDAVGDVLKFLEDYIVIHFIAEENIQLHYSYPGYPLHKAMHESFIIDIEGLKKQFEEEGSSAAMVERTNKVAIEWLLNHIKRMDKELADYLKFKGYTANSKGQLGYHA